MAHIGVAVLEEARAVADRLEDRAGDQRRPDRLIAGAEALGDRHQIRPHRVLLAGEHGAGAAHAAHHLVEDQQHAVAIADRAHRGEVARQGRHGAERGADHRLGDEADHPVGAEALDGRLELGREPGDVVRSALAGRLPAVGVARADMGDLGQQRLELLAAPGVAADRERPQRVAVIALAPGDEMAAAAGWPISTKYWRASLSAASIASEPPETK